MQGGLTHKTGILGADNRTSNILLRSMRSFGERGFALLAGRCVSWTHDYSSERTRRNPPSRAQLH